MGPSPSLVSNYGMRGRPTGNNEASATEPRPATMV